MRKIKQENEDMEYNIGAKMQRIDRDLEHIKVDLTSLSDKHQRILVIVRERTSTQCTEKDILTEKYAKLQSEIGALLARLDILRAEESLCKEKIANIDAEISTASERYQSELKVIEVDKDKCNQEQSELLAKKLEIQKEKARYDKKIEGLQITANNEKQLLNSIEKAISGSREMIEVFDQRLLESQHIKMKEERLLDEEIEETNDIKMFRKKCRIWQNRPECLLRLFCNFTRTLIISSSPLRSRLVPLYLIWKTKKNLPSEIVTSKVHKTFINKSLP